MKSILRPLVLALLAGVCPAQLAAPQVHLDVELGRAILVTTHGVQPLTALRGVTPFHGPGHLELAPGSRAVLRWRGIGSVSMRGPSSVAWHATDDSRVELNFGAVGSVNIEVRSLPLRVDLPGAWRLDLQTGAYSVYDQGSGGLDFVHRAGQSARVTWVGGGSLAPPPSTVRAGERLSMQGMPSYTSRQDTSAGAPGWNTSSWPWGNGSIENVPDLAVANAPAWAAEAWPWGAESNQVEAWERWDWPWSTDHAQLEGSLPEHARHVEEPAPMREGQAAPVSEPASSAQPSEPPLEAQPGAPAPVAGDRAAEFSEPAVQDERGHDQASQPAPLPVAPELPEHREHPVSAVESGPPASVIEPAGATEGEQDGPTLEWFTPFAQAQELGGEPPAEGGSSPAQPLQETAEGLQDAEGSPAQDPAPLAAVDNNSYDASLWRNLPQDQIQDLGAYRVQRGSALRREPLPNGDLRLSLEATSPQPYWYFSRHLDVRIFPGASLVVGPDGYLRYHNGTVRILTGDRARSF